MDAMVNALSSRARKPMRCRSVGGRGAADPRVTREEAEAAVRTLIAWAGDDPDREGLIDTPRRVAKAYRELFSGYRPGPRAKMLDRTFEEVGGYDDMVLVRDIPFYSHCEHHMVPFIGKAHVAYYPDRRRGRPLQARPRSSTSSPAACRRRRR